MDGGTVIPVVDVSRHQGDIDFTVMRSRGVEGLILRASHGRTVDDRAGQYYAQALAAGYAPNDVGWYSFINPKRGTGRECATSTAGHILAFTGGARPAFYMLDVEGYRNEPPNVGQLAWDNPAEHRQRFTLWLREHVETMRAILPSTPIIAYSNAAYYDTAVGDFAFASSLEWIVPRYPVYSAAGYARFPLPGVDGWEAWAWARAASGPRSPMNVPWAGWQFSAGHHAQGRPYGCDCDDLDLNIVDPAAWARWTTPITKPDPITPPPSQEDDDDMPKYLSVTASKGQALLAIDGGGVTFVGYSSPADKTALEQALGATPIAVSDAQFDAFVEQALWAKPGELAPGAFVPGELAEFTPPEPASYTLTATLTPQPAPR